MIGGIILASYSTHGYTEQEKKLYDYLLEDEELKTYPREVIKILFNRGVRTKEDIKYNLFGSINNLITIPMKGEEKFVNRLISSLNNEEQIVVMGDYDTDGTMATSVMVKGLRHLGFKINYYMNSRFVDGYGLKIPSVNEIVKLYPDVKVIITVDNGIKAFEAVDYCNQLGIDVLVTDHHEQDTEGRLPSAYTVVDPKQRGCMYPFKGLCGAGVAYKMLKALCSRFLFFGEEEEKSIDSLLWIVGIATVGDQVPMVSENRIIVKHMLEYVNDSENDVLFIKALKEYNEIETIKEDTIGFYFSPMINAMGRVEGNPIQVVDSILSDDYQEVQNIVKHMIEVNEVRREMTKEQQDLAIRMVGDKPKARCLVIASSSFTEGIVGLVAGRLTEKYNRPCLAMCIDEKGELKGSARSIEGIVIIDELDSVSDLFISYGGHEMAAGFTTTLENLDELTKRLNDSMEKYDIELFKEKVRIDLVKRVGHIDLSLCKLLENLGPYGNSFPKPVVFLKEFEVDKIKSIQNKANSFYVGKTGECLRLVDEFGFVAMGFKAAKKYKSLGEPDVVSLVGYPSINEFRGKESVQFIIDKNYVIKVK